MDKYRLTDHARKRMAEREISMRDVELALENPDIIQPSFDQRKIFAKFIRNKRLEVVTVSKENEIIIVTVYYAD